MGWINFRSNFFVNAGHQHCLSYTLVTQAQSFKAYNPIVVCCKTLSGERKCFDSN